MKGSFHFVGIHGAPRSGTSWLGQLFNSNEKVAYRFQPFFSYAFRDSITTESTRSQIAKALERLKESNDPFVLQEGDARIARRSPAFRKLAQTTLVYKEVRFHHLLEASLFDHPGGRFVLLIRDPRDVLASWINAPREFDPAWSILEQWRNAQNKNAGKLENWFGYERWKQLANMFVDLSTRRPERCRLVRYEDLLREPQRTIRSLFTFCELDYSPQTATFIEDSTSSDDFDPYGVYRRQKQHPQRELPAEVADEIVRDLSGTSLSPFLTDPKTRTI